MVLLSLEPFEGTWKDEVRLDPKQMGWPPIETPFSFALNIFSSSQGPHGLGGPYVHPYELLSETLGALGASGVHKDLQNRKWASSQRA